MILSIVRIIVMIFIIVLSPTSLNKDYWDYYRKYEFDLKCSDPAHTYPWRFLCLYLFDVASAVVDMIIWIFQPKTASEKDRLRETRVADIERSTVRRITVLQ